MNGLTVWSQTVLSIPPDVDMGCVLGEYMTFHGSQNQTNPVAGTASSRDALRRKLFSNAVETQTPQRNGGVCSSPIANDKGGLSTTPFSSSPIAPLRGSVGSSPEEGMQLSPICRKPGTRPTSKLLYLL